MQFLLLALNSAFALGILAWPMAAFSSIFFFDAPGSETNPLTIGLAISVLGYPVPAIEIIGDRHFNKTNKIFY